MERKYVLIWMCVRQQHTTHTLFTKYRKVPERVQAVEDQRSNVMEMNLVEIII